MNVLEKRKIFTPPGIRTLRRLALSLHTIQSKTPPFENLYDPIQINHQLDATVFSSLLSWRLFTAQHVSGVLTPIIRSSTTAVVASGYNRPDHDQQHCYHHGPKVKPVATTAVVELLMMSVRTPKTCWAVNKRQDNKLEKLLHLVGNLIESDHTSFRKGEF